jgi:hypothetical protein
LAEDVQGRAMGIFLFTAVLMMALWRVYLRYLINNVAWHSSGKVSQNVKLISHFHLVSRFL